MSESGVNEEAWQDAEILEAKVSALVEEFEQKHKSTQTQVSIVTRWRDPVNDKYITQRGGAAQVILHDLSFHGPSDEIHLLGVKMYMAPNHRIECCTEE